MLQKKIVFISCILLSKIITISAAEQLRGISIFSPRAQNDNAARDIAGWHPYIHRYDAQKNYKAFSLNGIYNQSLRPEKMSLALFNSDTFTLTGSQVEGREDTQELLADYFGLSPAFATNAFFKPLIRNVMLDGALYIGLDSWVKKLKFGKINCAQTKTGFAGLEWILGYDFISKETAHFGLNFRVTAPTGSRTKGKYFFEPRVGNGKLWEVGLGFTGHVQIWEKNAE